MSAAFSAGPFSFTPGSRSTTNGQASRLWTLSYASVFLAERRADEGASSGRVREVFADDISEFVRASRAEHSPDVLHLIEHDTGETVGQLSVSSWPNLTAGLADDSSRFWLLSPDRRRSMPVTLTQFGQIAAEHAAPENHWIAGLLPDDVMPWADEWRPPTSREIRHVVGQGSLTGISGERAALMIGMSAANFRKYTAHESVKNRQSISRAAWFLLLREARVIR